jgi:hypothetical protein
MLLVVGMLVGLVYPKSEGTFPVNVMGSAEAV